MASKFPPKLVQASNILFKNGSTYYKQMVKQNKHHVQEPPTIEKCQTLAKQLFYTLCYEAFGKEVGHFKNAIKSKEELNVENAGVECFAWFCGGEITGRGFTFTGYYV
ncbi:hypothetical protein D8674_019253 [Pyrus ussuriensis x Pyrus communis]|uniref:Mitochondrial ATP synthase subunit G protein n=1 Tax=Pyrus ussuriensis x Pyrus communis TaxID=2448454 RepID=A0A5N5GBT6_9ROSA|nr:hypothetical protein D8674_019253 [Pyrus ussuriensis x Pyrus communis]